MKAIRKFFAGLVLAAAGLLASASEAAVKVDTFAINTSAGNQSVVGVGFSPDVVIFWGTKETADGTSTGFDRASFGAYDGSVGSNVLWSRRASDDGAATGGIDNTRPFWVTTDTGQTEGAFSGVSLDADGFTVNVKTPDVGATAILVNYLAISCEAADVHKLTVTTGAGTISSTAPGFQPNLLIGFTSSTTGFDNTQATGGTGWTIGTGSDDEAALAYAQSQGNNNAWTRHDTNAFLFAPDDLGGVHYELALSSFDATGYTLTKTTAPGANQTILVVALKVADAWVDGARSVPTTTTTDVITGAGFAPDAFLGQWGTVEAADLDSFDSSGSRLGYGGYDGTNEAVTSINSNGTNGNTAERQLQTKAFTQTSAGGSTDTEADGTSLDADGATLTWTTAGGTDPQYSVLLFLSESTDTQPENLLLLGVGQHKPKPAPVDPAFSLSP